MSREELLSRVMTLESAWSTNRSRLTEMREHLAYFRQAVQVVVAAMEEEQVPVVMTTGAISDHVTERVAEMVKAEVRMKLKLLELEKQESDARRKVSVLEQTLADEQTTHRGEMDELTDALNSARKAETRSRNRLQYCDPSTEPAALARVHELEDQVLDLQSAEVKLRRDLEEVKVREESLRAHLEEIEMQRGDQLIPSHRRQREDKEKYYELLGQLQTLKSSEADLKERLQELRQEDSEALVQRISMLERREKGLQLKLELIEAQEPSLLAALPPGEALDSTDAILRGRVSELEAMDKHLRTQVAELEKDREELHEIARRDKSTIHDLNVKIRELQLSEKNLRDSLSRYDLEDSKLHSDLTELEDENEELRQVLEKVQVRERQLSDRVKVAELSECGLSVELESAHHELTRAQDKLRRQLEESEGQRRHLQDKCDHLSARVQDLSDTETGLRQRLRSADATHSKLSTKVREIEDSEARAETTIAELRGKNSILSEKVESLTEEKDSLMYDVSSLTFTRDERQHECDRLNSQVRTLRQRLEEVEERKSAMAQRLDDYCQKEVDLNARLQELEGNGAEWRDRIEFLEHNETKLRHRIHELEASVCSAQSLLSDSADNEVDALQSMVEYQRGQIADVEAQNSQLTDKLKLYEYARASDKMASVPSSELSSLRQQAERLKASERQCRELGEQEGALRRAVEELRQGKDSCGHDHELQQLREKADKSSKAQALMRTNYEETKSQLTDLQTRLKSGEEAVKQTSSKCVQARLVEQYTLTQLSPEFGVALRSLGTHHPEAYDTFIRLLHPCDTSSHMPPTQDNHELHNKLTQENSLWKTVEGQPQEEVTVTVDFSPDRPLYKCPSVESLSSNGSAPPLPAIAPPVRSTRSVSPSGESYYLPSADEVTDLPDEEFTSQRARSKGRDIADSETTRETGNKPVESMTSDSGYQDVLRNRVQYLEGEVQRLHSSTDTQAMRKQILTLERELTSQKKRVCDAQVEAETRQRQIQTLTLKLELLERTRDNKSGHVDKSPITLSLKHTPSSSQPITEQNTESFKDKQIKAKTNEVDRLSQELRKLQEEYRKLLDQSEPSKQNHEATDQQKFADLQRKYEQVLKQNSTLQSHLHNLELTQGEQVKDREVMEIQSLEAKVKMLEAEVKEKSCSERDLLAELSSLRHLAESQERELVRQQGLEEKYTTAVKQHTALKQKLQQVQTSVTPLRARVLALTHRLTAKHNLLQRLTTQLKRYENASAVLTDAEKELAETDTLLSPRTAALVHKHGVKTETPPSTPPTDSEELLHRSSDSEELLDPNLINNFTHVSSDKLLHNGHIHQPSALLNHPSHSSPSIKTNPHHHRTKQVLPADSNNNNNEPIKTSVNQSLDSVKDKLRLIDPKHISYRPVTLVHPPGKRVTALQYKAVKDYSPELYSRSTRPSEELSLREGDHLRPRGHTSLPNSQRATPTSDIISSDPIRTQARETRRPHPPARFRVSRVVGNDSLLLSWEPPAYDQLTKSNGVIVIGYKLTIDSVSTQHLSSPYLCKALVEHLCLSVPHTFSLCTSGESGISSVPVDTAFTDVHAPLDTSGSSTQAASRRVFIAVYDSPGTGVDELPVCAGDVVVCYGAPRADGCYRAKVHGRKGLVPAHLIEEVAVLGTRTKPSVSSSSPAPSSSLDSHRQSVHDQIVQEPQSAV